jgi:hypothetical protein
MGEQDHALHEIADARARMSELADELALHARPEHVKELAAEKVGEWKERAKELASEKAVELKEQAKEAIAEKASDMKTHAKEAVMHKTIEVKDKVDTPRGWSFLGAIIGAGVGGILMKKAFTIRQERSIGVGSEDFRYRGEEYSPALGVGVHGGTPAAGMSGDISAMGGYSSNIGTTTHTDVNLKERASDVAHSVMDKATGLKDRAMGAVEQVRDQASHLRERIPSGSELKGRTGDWFDRAVENQPLMLALGSMALGVFASLLIPVSSRERQLIEPAKRKAQEGISQLGEQLEHRIQGQDVAQGAGTSSTSGASMNTGSSYQGDIGAMRSSTLGATDRSEDLMGAERPGFDGSGSRIPPPPPLDDVSTKIH